jgi:putative sugar O-methyltransferase
MKSIKTLIQNYHSSLRDFNKIYHLHNSSHWKEFNQDKIINEQNLKNFRSSGLSNGLDDQNSTNFKFFNKIENLVGKKFLFKNMLKKNVGNSQDVYKFGSYFIDYNQLVFIYHFKKIETYLNKKNVKIVCEIGGGFGQFSELILNNKKIKLILIDLPLSNLLSSYYLMKNFPKKNFYLFDDYSKKNILSKKDLKNHDIFILPPNFKIEKNIKIDFFINMRSMMEMKKSTVSSYFKFIQKYASKKAYFFNLNRFHKKIGKEIISFEDFSYDKNWDVVSSGKSFNQNWIYFVLSVRKFKKFKKPIRKELKNIREHGKKFRIETNIILIMSKFFLTMITSISLKLIALIFGKSFLLRIANRLINYR